MARLALAGLLFAGAAPAAGGTPLLQQESPRLGAHESAGLEASLRRWLEARFDGDAKAIAAARLALMESFRAIQEAAPEDVLGRVADWEALLERSRSYQHAAPRDGVLLPGAGGELGESLFAAPSGAAGAGPGSLLVFLSDSPGGPREGLAKVPDACRSRFLILVPDLRGLPAGPLTEGLRRRVLLALSAAVRTFSVDRNRVLLLGEGGAAASATELAALLPHLFAAAAVTGGSAAAQGADGNLELLPFQRAADLESACSWLAAAQPRDPYPLRFEVSFRSPAAGRVFWVQAMKFDPAGVAPELAHLSVEVDRESNTILLDASRVYRVTLFLNDRIIDLDRPIQILRNGVPYEFKAARSFRTLLENFAINLDPRALFPAMVRDLDLPSRP